MLEVFLGFGAMLPPIILAAAVYRRAEAAVIRAKRIDPRNPNFRP
jgi:hypothetical protein